MAIVKQPNPGSATNEGKRSTAPSSRHGPIAQALLALSPLSLILLAYAAADWVNSPIDAGHPGAGANRLGIALHVRQPASVDRSIFGVVPSAWLQQHLFDGPAHWYDGVAALVYITHFIAIPLVTVIVWFRLRARFAAWLAALLGFTLVGVGGYVVYPAAPPWLASQRGAIGPVHRISGLGWDYFPAAFARHLVVAAEGTSNTVAAMPSLHAGAALLVTLFLWPVLSRLWRAALLCYVMAMAAMLVYTGEHYVIDIVAGWLTAIVAMGCVPLILRGTRWLGRVRQRRAA